MGPLVPDSQRHGRAAAVSAAGLRQVGMDWETGRRRFVALNSRFAEMCGVPREELLVGSLSLSLPLSPSLSLSC